MAYMTRLLVAGVTVLVLIQAVSAFMCYKKDMGDDSSSVEYCSTGTCFSMGAGVGDAKAVRKGCAEKSYEEGCVNTGLPGIASAHMCYCSLPFCNAASPTHLISPTILIPLLILPALLNYLN